LPSALPQEVNLRFLRTNTAVIVSVGPFYDKTDGVTPETALTITNERITLVADTDGGSAPTIVLDNVTGATSGTANDLNYITGQDNGMMQLELAAADTNRLGRMMLTITDAANHVPVFHEFMVMPALVYDTFFASSGGATFPAATLASTTNITAGTITTATNVTTVNGLAANVITAAATATDFGAEVATAVWTDTTAGDFTVAASIGKSVMNGVALGTGLTANAVTTVNGLAANVITAASMADDASTEVANKVWDTDATGHQTQGTFGQAIGDPVADTGTIFKATVTDATGVTVGTDTATLLTRLGTPSDLGGGATVAANLSDIEAQTDDIGAAGAGLTAINLPDQTMNITGNITGNLSGSVGSVTGLTAADVGAIKAKTDSLTFTVANKVDANIKSVADTTVTGVGSEADPWGP
jgi:hypothetical protein